MKYSASAPVSNAAAERDFGIPSASPAGKIRRILPLSQNNKGHSDRISCLSPAALSCGSVYIKIRRIQHAADVCEYKRNKLAVNNTAVGQNRPAGDVIRVIACRKATSAATSSGVWARPSAIPSTYFCRFPFRCAGDFRETLINFHPHIRTDNPRTVSIHGDPLLANSLAAACVSARTANLVAE